MAASLFRMPEAQSDDFRSAWQEVFENAKLVAVAPRVPEAVRWFWAAVLRGDIDEAVALLDAMDRSDQSSG